MASAFSFGFGSVPAKKPDAEKEEEHDKENDNELMDEPELAVTDGGAAKFAAVEVTSGEENFDVVCKIKAKIWRFDEGENSWKERGTGDVKILTHKVTKRAELIFRREGTNKLAAYHQLVPGIAIKKPQGNDKCFVWTSTNDYADEDEPGQGHPESFLIRFPAVEAANEFHAAFTKFTAK
jgi:Ran-binding protein 1